MWDLIKGNTYYIKVRIKGNELTHTDSEWSDIFVYTPEKVQNGRPLSTPQNLRIEKNVNGNLILKWDSVYNALWYSICFNGNAFNHETGTEFLLTGWDTELDVNIKIKALGDSVLFADSKWTDAINYSSYDQSKQFNMLGIDIKYDNTNDSDSSYVNADSGFYTNIAGFDLTKCRIYFTDTKLIIKYLNDGITIELIFNKINNSDFDFIYKEYFVRNINNANDGIYNNIVNNMKHLDSVLSSGTAKLKVI